ncbi:hypothetical protein V6N13_013432 [Hibiscus sabdariffa]|uniref:PGG domain-containing protein n=2 Tax=Hibiscus sabdariffa TaxID=183260 RepID=A0ABR2BVA8_9ROSI
MGLDLCKTEQPLLAIAVDSSTARHNLHFAAVLGTILCLLPTENIGENKVPRLFHGHQSAFYLCVVSVVFTFTGSFTALMIGDDSKTSRFCSLYSFVAMVLTLSSLAYVLAV